MGRSGNRRVVHLENNPVLLRSEIFKLRQALEIVAQWIHPQHMSDQLCNQLAPYVIAALCGKTLADSESIRRQWVLIEKKFKNMKKWPPEVKRRKNDDFPF